MVISILINAIQIVPYFYLFFKYNKYLLLPVVVFIPSHLNFTVLSNKVLLDPNCYSIEQIGTLFSSFYSLNLVIFSVFNWQSYITNCNKYLSGKYNVRRFICVTHIYHRSHNVPMQFLSKARGRYESLFSHFSIYPKSIFVWSPIFADSSTSRTRIGLIFGHMVVYEYVVLS